MAIRTSGLTTLVLAATALGPAIVPTFAAPVAARRTACDARPGSTYLTTLFVRIYRTGGGSGSSSMFVCRRRSRTTALVARISARSTFSSVAQAGRFVVAEITTMTEVGINDALVLATLGGQRLAEIDLSDVPSSKSDYTFDYLLTSGGGVAIRQGSQLVGYDANGRRVLSDSEPIDMAAKGNRVYWTDAAGQAHSAKLSGHATAISAAGVAAP